MNATRHRFLLSASLLAVAILTGCAGNTTFHRPEFDLPEGTPVAESPSLALHASSVWWTVFHDKKLDRLEERALARNRNLAQAAATVERAVALSGMADAALYPQLGIDAGATREELTTGQQYSQRLASRGRDVWQMSGVLSYELDLWGKLSARSEAARNDILSSIAARDAVCMRLTAEVATAYISVLTWQEKCRIISSVHESYERSCSMYEKRFEQGQYPELELRRVQAERAKTLARLKKAENSLAHAETVLAVLIGESPRQIMGRTSAGTGNLLSQSPPVPPEGIPADLLERRPDLAELEYRLASAGNRADEARRDRLPDIRLTGKWGQVSTALDNILKGKSRLFSLDVDMFQYLFDGVRRKAAVRVADAEYRQLEAAYEQAVLTAYGEVRDALVERSKSAELYHAVEDEVNRTQRSWDIASKQYAAGYIGLMDVLDIHRNLLNCELDQADAAELRLTSVVHVCKALGGGWKR